MTMHTTIGRGDDTTKVAVTTVRELIAAVLVRIGEPLRREAEEWAIAQGWEA